jgi:Fic family protein
MTFKPKFSITNKIINMLSMIERVKGFLDAAVLSKEWIKEMQNHALILEAHYTTHIEGIQLTLDQAEKIFAGKKVTNVNIDDRKELLNYKDAFEFVSEYLDNHEPITEGLIREIHKRLVEDVRGGSAAPGEYRKIQNYVVNSRTGKTIYTPPPAYEVPKMVADLVAWLRMETKINPILVAGIAQFQLVHIHPFLDGNGRTARLLSTLYLYKSGYDFKRLFTISEFYDKDRLGYYAAIQSVRNKNMDMTEWLEYFTHALSTQMKEIRSKGELVIKTDLFVKKYDLSDRQRVAVNYLLKNKSMSIKEYAIVCPKINRRTLQRELKELIEKGIIRTKGATNKLRYFLKGNL